MINATIDMRLNTAGKERKMKKLFTMALTGLMAVSMVACSGGSSEKPAEGGEKPAEGGEAAAATAVVDLSESASDIPPKNYYFTVDHPFIYMIIEISTGAAIFMGRVTDL